MSVRVYRYYAEFPDVDSIAEIEDELGENDHLVRAEYDDRRDTYDATVETQFETGGER